MNDMLHRYLSLDDLIAVRDRMIGAGSIGGKAQGMLLARAILRRDQPDAARPPGSARFVLRPARKSSTRSSYPMGCEWIRRQQREPETFLKQLDEAHERIMGGSFTQPTLRQFAGMLDYFGEWPYIVRSQLTP